MPTSAGCSTCSGLTDDTHVVLAGDNGPEDVLLWRGSRVYWEGSYFAGGEGNLRTPCLVRWREPVALPHLHTWVATHFNRLIGEFEANTKREPPIPAGAPLDHVPASSG